MRARIRFWGALVMAATLAADTSGVAANPCAQFITCEEVPTSYSMRYPRQTFPWGFSYIPTGAHVIFVHDDALQMFRDAVAIYAGLDPAVPNDPAELIMDPSGYNNQVLWVPQQSLPGNPAHGDYPLATTAYYFSGRPAPRCYILRTTISIAVDPTDGTHSGCWRNGWDQYCEPNACGYNQYDFPSVIRHEVGHAYGLTDNTAGTMMVPNRGSCTYGRSLAQCERDTVRRRYRDNPAATIEAFTAYRSEGGTEVRWEVLGGERIAEFRVARGATLIGPWETLASVSYHGAGPYEVQLPGVQDGAVALYEVESDGGVVFHRRDEITDPPSGGTTPSYTIANLDSIWAKLTKDGPRFVLNDASPIQNVIIAPDLFMTAAERLASYKRDYLGINSVARSLESIGGDQMIRSTILELEPTSGTVTLLGSRWEGQSLSGVNLYTNPTLYYVHGRVFPGYPNEPQRNIIRSEFVVDTTGIDSSLTSLQPWLATDAVYVDFLDEDNEADPFPDGDGIPDEGRAIGRLPAATVEEADALVTWTAAHWYTSPYGAVWNFVFGEDVGWPPRNGEIAISMADSLATVGLPPHTNLRRVEASATHLMTAAQRDAAYALALNSGGILLNKVGSTSGGYSEIDFGSEHRGFNYGALTPSPGYAPVELGWSCYTANDAATRSPSLGDRPAAQLLKLGMIRAKIGATAGTYQRTNLDMQQAWYAEWLGDPTQGIGKILAAAQRRAVRVDPRNAFNVPEYALLGDPDLRVPLPAPPLVGVAERTIADFRMTVRPNPAWSEVAVAWLQPTKERVQLTVYDVAGRKVASILSRDVTAGLQTASWNPDRTIGAGIYYLLLKSGSRTSRTSVVLMR